MSQTKKAIAIVSVLLGVIGAGASLLGFVMYALNPQIQRWNVEMQRRIGAPPDQIEMQERLVARVEEVTRPFQPVGMALNVVKLGLALVLIAGGVQTLRGRASSMLLLACWAALPIETIVTAFGFVVQTRTSAATREVMLAVPGPAAAQAILDSSLTAGVILGLTIAIGWLLLKLAFFTWAVFVLRSEP